MTNQNDGNKHKKLFSLVALVYFPFLVDFLLKDSYDDYSLTEKDYNYISTYKKAGYIVIIISLLLVFAFFLSYYLSSSILLYFSYLIGFFLIYYLFFNIYLNFVKETEAFLFSKNDVLRIKAKEIKAGNFDYFYLYLPFVNSYLFYYEKFSNNQEYWLKESLFLYFFLSIFGILALFFPYFINIFYLILIFIIVRVVSLLFGLDFIPDFLKKYIYYSYKFSLLELFRYICALVYFLFVNLFLILSGKNTKSYNYYLSNVSKNFEAIDIKTVLKNYKKYLFLILSYFLLFLLLVYIFYISLLKYNPYIYIFSLLLFLSYFLFLKRVFIGIPLLTPLLKFILKKVI